MIDNSGHEGVGLIIRSGDVSLWFVQQKDETYPIEKWQLSYSVWGGAMEEGEEPQAALLRELEEELSWNPPKMPDYIGRQIVHSDSYFAIHLYEYTMPAAELKVWAEGLDVQEGYGKLVAREALFGRTWVWDLDKLIKNWYGELLD